MVNRFIWKHRLINQPVFKLNIISVFLLILVFVFSLNSIADEKDTVFFEIDPETTVFYEAPIKVILLASATVRGDNHNINGYVRWVKQDPKPLVKCELTIATGKFDSGNSTRDRDIRNILEADRYHEILFELKDILGVTNAQFEEISGEYLAVGDLTVRNVTQTLSIPVIINFVDEKLIVEGSVGIRYTDFEIPPPRVAGIVTRAPDELRIGIKLVAVRVRT